MISAVRTYLEVHCCESVALKHTTDTILYYCNTATDTHILGTIQQHTTPDTIQITTAIPLLLLTELRQDSK